MLVRKAPYLIPVALSMMLGACSWFSQPAAPVVAGTESGSYSTSVSTSNPYGATPYDPNAAGASVTPSVNTGYTAPTYTAPTYTPPAASTGSYVPSYAPVDINAATHTVVKGDTVYNISKRYNITQDNLRAWNNISDNNIGVGQVLRVKPAGYVAPTSNRTAPVAQAVSPVVSQPVVTPSTPASTATVSGATRTVEGITWQRPTAGNVISSFGGNNKGVDIAGSAGQNVLAAADGKVVYAGSGLRGYGNLVIVQHNSTFLTAYGNNQSLNVKEGQSVKRGQVIARMGNTDADRTKLHFEVRKDGKPVNPNGYVPL
ncbi:MAG: peptidoglycan DD-metalloendopeptidase family protein [Neisseria sp.]|nr:peptidoglycan DD-metalloendopeptidase family protein [Neisseria sp.]